LDEKWQDAGTRHSSDGMVRPKLITIKKQGTAIYTSSEINST